MPTLIPSDTRTVSLMVVGTALACLCWCATARPARVDGRRACFALPPRPRGRTATRRPSWPCCGPCSCPPVPVPRQHIKSPPSPASPSAAWWQVPRMCTHPPLHLSASRGLRVAVPTAAQTYIYTHTNRHAHKQTHTNRHIRMLGCVCLPIYARIYAHTC